MKKLIFLFAVLLTSVGAWAQTSYFEMGTSTTSLSDGNYVLVAMSEKGTGPVIYDLNVNEKHYRYEVGNTLAAGDVVSSKYVWTIDETTVDGVQHITVTNYDDNTKAFPADVSHNQNFTGSGVASLLTEVKTIGEANYIALSRDIVVEGNTCKGYVHANAPGGNPCLSYWESYDTDGTCVKFTFYPVTPTTKAPLFVEPVVGGFYKLKGDNSAKPWLTNQLTGNSIVVSADEADAAIFERTTNGLKDVATGKYLGMTGSVVSLVASETNVTIGEYYNDTEDGRKYSVKASNSYMYNNNTDGKTHESSGWNTNIERYWGFIEVVLTETDLTYTLTDNAGNQYTGAYSGVAGVTRPTIAGASYTLSNEGWENDNTNFTATITFPFPVSSASVTNATMISSFKDGGGNYPGAGRFKWYADADDVKILRDASVTKDNLKSYSWAIYPELQNGAFAFSIKSIKTGGYIKATKDFGNNSGDNNEGTVILSDTPTKFFVDSNNSLYFYAQDRNQYLSWGSVNNASGFLGVHTKTVTAGHNGITNSFHAAVIDLASKDDFVNGEIYTFVTARGWMGAKEGNNNVISTAKASHGLTGSYSDPMFQWTVYKSKDGYYYLYNLGKQQFMGVQSTNNASIPFAAQPAGKNLTFKNNGQTTGYPIMFSTDNAGVANHSTDQGDGLITWTGGWNKMDDDGSNHKVSYVGKLSDEEAQAIADKVEFYLNNVTALDQLSNTATYKVYGERGFIYATEGGELKGTNKHSVTYDEENPYHHFAILKVDGNYYLYNVGAKKFVIKNGNTASLSDTPARQTFAMGAASNLNTAYDWVLRLDGTLAHLSNAVGSGVYVNNSSEDEGTRWAILKVGNFTPDDALYVINNYNRQLYVKAVVEGSWDNNPNTHFGTITATSNSNTFSTKLKTDPIVATLAYNGLAETTTIGFTRAYRGFEFQGFYVDGELVESFTLTDAFKASNTAENPLVAKFTATEDVTLFYDDDEFSYRIPAIATTSAGRIIAVTDYRHNLDDIGRDNHGTGTKRIDLVARTSDDNGKTWSDVMTIAAGDNSKTGSYERAFGDAAIAAVGENIVVMAAAGDVVYVGASASNPNRMARIFSSDNGATWSKEEITTKMYNSETSLIPNGVAAFFGSGKLVVDANYNGSGKARIYGALLVRTCINGQYNNYNNYAVYSDDLGANWSILGGSQTPVASGDEPKVEILPNGQILLSARRGGGRLFNVFTYADKANNTGTWDTATNGCGNGGNNATNGEIFCVDAKKADGTAVKLLMQSQPKGGSGQYDRKDVSIWYKEVSDAVTYTSAQIASDWTQGLQVSRQQSSYSAVTMQTDGKVALFFEEAPCYGDDYTKGYSMVYTPLTIEQITKNNYFNPEANVEDMVKNINVVLTDAQGNKYYEVVENIPASGIVATALTTKYPFITLGENPNLEVDGDNCTYTNTVTLPFKVSNEETTVWYNIYWPANTNENGYPVYLSASAAGDQYVPKVTESNVYGNSSYNTANNAAKISWAVYSVDNGFTFKFKNMLTDKFIQATSVATGNSQNVKYVAEADATAFEIVKKTGNYHGDYALKAVINGSTGYLCSTIATGYHYATHYNGNGHQGAWVKFAEAPDFEALFASINSAIESVNENYDFGTGLGQYQLNGITLEEISAAIDESNSNRGNLKVSELNNYKAKVDAPVLNLPVAGQFFRIRGISGNYIDATSIYNNANATTGQMSMKSAEACNYNGTIFYFDEDKHLLNYSTGTYTKQTSYIGAVGDADKAVWTISESPRKGGKYALRNTVTSGQNGQQLHDSDGNRADRCGSNCGERHDFTLEEVTSLPFTFNSKALGFATFCAPEDIQLPSGVVAYIAKIIESSEGDALKMRKFDENVVPANTPVMLYHNGVEEENVSVSLAIVDGEFSRDDLDEIAAKNDFDGTIAAATYPANTTVYSLQKHKTEPKVGFYQKTGGDLGGFKSWIMITGENSARTFTIIFDGDDATGLKEALGLENENVEIYDLSGRRLDKPTKGVNVVGGKLVIK